MKWLLITSLVLLMSCTTGESFLAASPSFRYGDHVVVTNGFFLGAKGIVKDHFCFRSRCQMNVLFRWNEAWIDQSDLKKIGE